MHPFGRTHGAARRHDVVMAVDEIHGQPGERPEHLAVYLREFIHDPFEPVVQTAFQEQLPIEREQRPHEHGVVKPHPRGRTLGRVVAPIGGIIFSVSLINKLSISPSRIPFFSNPKSSLITYNNSSSFNIFSSGGFSGSMRFTL